MDGEKRFCKASDGLQCFHKGECTFLLQIMAESELSTLHDKKMITIFRISIPCCFESIIHGNGMRITAELPGNLGLPARTGEIGILYCLDCHFPLQSFLHSAEDGTAASWRNFLCEKNVARKIG